MPEAATTFDVREVSETARVIDIEGDITAQQRGRADGRLRPRER